MSFDNIFSKVNLNGGGQNVNIMLMGETGVGKSTFINAIANYFRFEDFGAAIDEEIHLLIPTHFSILDYEGEEHQFEFGNDKNETLETGKAGTQSVKTYIFPIGETGRNLCLIDTPGMGDPRGVAQDEENCENILQFISGIDQLHAICFLMKPTNTRTTALFTYCVKQILSRLDKSASENIVFVFTNTRGTNYTPGDTMGVLKKMVKEIAASPPFVTIPLKDNIFSMDNEAFRFLLSIQKGVKFNDSVMKCCFTSWEISSKESWRFINYITGDEGSTQGLQPHDVKNTLSVNEVRSLIDQLSKPLSDIAQLIQDNLRALEKQEDFLTMENQTLEELKNKLFMPVVTLKVKELTQPVTVCTDKKCALVVQVGEKTKWHYKQRCHNPCYLTGVPKEVIGDTRLINCAAMNGKSTCQECGCDYRVHMHIYYETETVNDKIEDVNVKENITSKELALQETETLIKQMNDRKLELEREHNIIGEIAAKFAHFLQRHAITPFNDAYKEYLEHLIIREKSLGDSADLKTIEGLGQTLKKHEEAKFAFNQSLSSSNSARGSVITPDTIKQDINRLYSLKHNGKKIKELMDKQKTARSKEYNFSYESVSVLPVTRQRQNKNRKQKNNESLQTVPTGVTKVTKPTEVEKINEKSLDVQDQSPTIQQRSNDGSTGQCQYCQHNIPNPQFPHFWPPPPPFFNYFMPPPNMGSYQDMYRMYEAYARMPPNNGVVPPSQNTRPQETFKMLETSKTTSGETANGWMSLEYTHQSQQPINGNLSGAMMPNPREFMAQNQFFYPFPYMCNPNSPAFSQNDNKNLNSTDRASNVAPAEEETFVDSVEFQNSNEIE